jgi:hypothetical protein
METIHLDEIWRGEVSCELRHIVQSMGDIQRQLCELQSSIAQQLAEHVKYHHENEHRWGAIKWCSMHPFRLAAIAGVITAWYYGEEIIPLIRILAGAI